MLQKGGGSLQNVFNMLKHLQLEIAAQGIAQCKVSATRVVADAALRRGVLDSIG